VELALFAVFGMVALGAAVLVVSARRLVYSALFLVVSFVGMAGLFILQGAQFIGAVQILLYAGSIVVMFVFVIMMVRDKAPPPEPWSGPRALAAAGVAGTLFLELLWVMSHLPEWGRPVRTIPEGASGHTQALGRVLFRQYLLPFELLTLLLLAAFLGLLVLGRRK
jgi:NADH-quinone oxidoreductase subunit J